MQHLWIQLSQLQPGTSGGQPEVGINTDHSQHYSWKKKGLEPFYKSPETEVKMKNWKLSVWLKLLSET